MSKLRSKKIRDYLDNKSRSRHKNKGIITNQSKSQINQDINVLKFYNNKRNGYFIEIGVNDGVCISNSLLLEEKYDWKGICVEPIPEVYKNLCINRPNTLCCDMAVYNKSNEIVKFDVSACGLLSGIASDIDCHKTKVDSNKRTIDVLTITLDDLLEKYNAPNFIEYLSIDTEGSEFEILKVFNFNKYIFGLIDVEHNYIQPKREKIKQLLLDNGYIYIGENHHDDRYHHKSLVPSN